MIAIDSEIVQGPRVQASSGPSKEYTLSKPIAPYGLAVECSGEERVRVHVHIHGPIGVLPVILSNLVVWGFTSEPFMFPVKNTCVSRWDLRHLSELLPQSSQMPLLRC